jgi:hypothetical protein
MQCLWLAICCNLAIRSDDAMMTIQHCDSQHRHWRAVSVASRSFATHSITALLLLGNATLVIAQISAPPLRRRLHPVRLNHQSNRSRWFLPQTTLRSQIASRPFWSQPAGMSRRACLSARGLCPTTLSETAGPELPTRPAPSTKPEHPTLAADDASDTTVGEGNLSSEAKEISEQAEGTVAEANVNLLKN